MSEIEEKNKIPRYVWYSGLFFFLIAIYFAALAAYKGQWLGLSSILLALAAVPIVRWRMGLLDKQVQIQQQREYRQSYFDSIKYLESESFILRIGAIHELAEQLKTDKQRRLQIIKIFLSVLHKTTIEEGDTKIEKGRKRNIVQTTLDILACLKPEWLSYSGFSLREITFNKDTEEIVGFEIKNLKGVDLLNADFRNTDIRGAVPLEGANFEGANLQGANFTKVPLYYANFERANLTEANFTKANLSHANFKQADCDKTNFEGANLTEANFTKAHLYETDLSQATDITQEQINLAFGSVTTKLPPYLKMPPHWLKNDLDITSYQEWKKWKADPENYIPPEKK